MPRTPHPFIKSIRSDQHATTQIGAPETTVRQTERTPLENELLAALQLLLAAKVSDTLYMDAHWATARAAVAKATA